MKLDSYKVNRKHRERSAQPTCTQWVIDEWEEVRLFSVAKRNHWVCTKSCLWAIEKEGSSYRKLGVTDKEEAYLAKYVTNRNNEWHGYPVTTSRDADRPPTEILDSWRNEGLITKPVQGRIVRGKW